MEEVVELFWDAQTEMYYTPAYGGIYFDYYGKYGPAGELFIVVLNLWTINGELPALAPPPPEFLRTSPTSLKAATASMGGGVQLANLNYPRTGARFTPTATPGSGAGTGQIYRAVSPTTQPATPPFQALHTEYVMMPSGAPARGLIYTDGARYVGDMEGNQGRWWNLAISGTPQGVVNRTGSTPTPLVSRLTTGGVIRPGAVGVVSTTAFRPGATVFRK
mgnify:CR=1 FL=1